MSIVKSIIRAPFRSLGYDIVRRQVPNHTWLQELDIRTILDIGANVGQYAMESREIFPTAQIYSFEPLKDCFEQLKLNMRSDAHFTAFNLALGTESGETEFQHNEHSPASSLLKMSGLHREHYPYAVATISEKVRIERLDDIVGPLHLETPLMVKIDVQGFEDQVIAGGEETVRKAKLLIVETSFKPLYEGQPLFDAIYETLKRLGMSYFGSNHQVRSAVDSRVLQENSVFLREG